MTQVKVDYEQHGLTYSRHRISDPFIAQHIHSALGTARTVLNIGAGTGSYEPTDRWVLAIEPSATMRAQRDAAAAPAIDGRAEALPFDDNAVDAAMACVTIHHWEPPELGLKEMRRVASGPVVIFTFDLAALPAWQQDYLGDALAFERPRFPSMERIAKALGGEVRIEEIPTPGKCVDGFFEAFWNRPEALLDPHVRSAQSIWALLPQGGEEKIVKRLAADLASGVWDDKYGDLRSQEYFDGALRLVVSELSE